MRRLFCLLIACLLIACSSKAEQPPQETSGAEVEVEAEAEVEAEVEAEAEAEAEVEAEVEVVAEAEAEAEVEADVSSERIERVESNQSAMIERIERIERVESPQDVIRRCRYAQDCIIEALRNRTDSARVLGVLAAAYEATGDHAAHERTVITLKRLYPNSSVARMY